MHKKVAPTHPHKLISLTSHPSQLLATLGVNTVSHLQNVQRLTKSTPHKRWQLLQSQQQEQGSQHSCVFVHGSLVLAFSDDWLVNVSCSSFNELWQVSYSMTLLHTFTTHAGWRSCLLHCVYASSLHHSCTLLQSINIFSGIVPLGSLNHCSSSLS